MNYLSIEDRILRLKKVFEDYSRNPDHKFTLEAFNQNEISFLKSKDYFPPDMLMILEHLGSMRNWGHLDCAMIDWWMPSSLENSIADQRSAYDLQASNFINASNLLFFAWDCEARCYLYDTTISPWKVVVCDGLDVSIYNGNTEKNDKTWDGVITPWEDPQFPDALSIIENWAL